jgi:ATP-binding cassette subfamily F protein 3
VLLSVNNVVKSFGVDEVLGGVTFRLDQREKVALVGPNGAGKTTLLKIITGQTAPDGGSVHLAAGAKVGYLRQDVPVSLGRTVLEEAQSGLTAQVELRKRLEELEAHLDEGVPEVLEEYALLHEHFLEAEGYSVEHDVRTVLLRMGFAEEEFSRQTALLSGGEKTRLALARLLLEEPDLLILDEPTNHLDLQATEWIEDWIRGYHGAVLLVSHDRAFLENTAERVVDLRDGVAKLYPGAFEKYLVLRAEEDQRQAEVAKRQEQEIAKLDEYVRRFMNSQRTAQARGRLKRLERLKEEKVNAPSRHRVMKAAFGNAQRSGEQVVEASKLEIGYGAEKLLGPFNWSVRIGERWGVIGENGVGKSTLLKVLIEDMEPLAGSIRLGSNVYTGVFFQDASDMDPEQSPLDLLVWEEDMLPADARNLLGRFLITGDDVYRPIKTLSGGERNKLSLARLTRLNPNLLILDEPTNHLDIDSRQALAEVLSEYKGTLILVSHDRWLLSQVTDHTLDLRRKEIVVYPGSYADYRARRLTGRPMQSVSLPAESTGPSGLNQRELSKEIQRTERALAVLEAEIEESERRLRNLESSLSSLKPGEDVWELTRSHEALKQEIDARLGEWESESIRLGELRSRQGPSG